MLSCINEVAKDFFVNNKNRKGPTTTESSKDYQPFVKIADIFSLGRSHRVFGHKTKRTHHYSPTSATKEEIAEFMKSEFPQAKYKIEAVNSSGSILSHDIGLDDLRPGGTVSGPFIT